MNRKPARNDALPAEDTERVLGVMRLIGQLEAIVEESGIGQGFDAAHWLSNWLHEPVPDLGGVKPLSPLATMARHAMVADVLAKVQSGAYA